MESGRTRVTYQRNPNFCERIGQSLIGILIGAALLLLASGVIFWNEGRAVQTAKSLDEGLSIVVPLANAHLISSENTGKLVHLTGELHTQQDLVDGTYNIRVRAVKLKRIVEMYQWEEQETEKKYDEGNGQTRVEKSYSYSKVWKSNVIHSNGFDDSFNHRNPSEMPVREASFNTDVNVGEFLLSDGLTGQINNFRPVTLSPSNTHVDSRVKIKDNYFYHGQDVLYPEIGDVRVKFEYAGRSGPSLLLGSPDEVSIVARQVGSKLLPYQTVSGDTLEMLYFGSLSAKEMFGREKMQNTMMTWALRSIGWLMMFIGFSCLTSIVTTLVDWLPIVRDIIALGVCLMNMSLSVSLSLTIIAIGWIFYRPVLGIAILAMAATPFVLSRFRGAAPRSRVD
ncbi:transmembrane protein 43-like [Dreissena polymorpha]|uniref:Transmembrane protein 43 n=1 Tax=Dreissena polymorpha TaxID=45954 RepID=A0A9D4JT86_DREPO|nr:transmembrane protein 43-like [Dreissena polymorpha]KAH3819307.1 hypothetical protein DPMN_121041 [Dreissena polymorpha]